MYAGSSDAQVLVVVEAAKDVWNSGGKRGHLVGAWRLETDALCELEEQHPSLHLMLDSVPG